MPKPRTAPIRLQVSVSEELDEAVKDFRFSHRFESESLALNALITIGLAAFEAAWKAVRSPEGGFDVLGPEAFGAGSRPKPARKPR